MAVEESIWGIIRSIATVGTLGTAIVGVIFGLRSSRKLRIDRKTQFLNKYLTEYRSSEMGIAVQRLYEMYEYSERDELKLLTNYIKYCKKHDSKFTKNGEDFHFTVRRKVTQFYLQMAFAAETDREIKNILFQIWSKGNLDIIRDIILPLELFAVPHVIADNDEKIIVKHRIERLGESIVIQPEWAQSWIVLANFFNEAVERSSKTHIRHIRRDLMHLYDDS
jgi:hypothetical protein